MFNTILPEDLSTKDLHGILLGAVAPRPIAFASTIDAEENVNLSPFSYFNVFSSRPPILVFSPSRRVRDNTTKDTLDNVLSHPEVAISIVSYHMLNQMVISSAEYPKHINEFEKSGFTPSPSQQITPPFVSESPVSFECKVNQIVSMGESGGAGSLVICEVFVIHLKKSVLDPQGKIDPFKLDAMGRMGGNWYCRAQGEALIEVPRPGRKLGIGVDQIPHHIRNSSVLTGNDLGRLASISELPNQEEIQSFSNHSHIRLLKQQSGGITLEYRRNLHLFAQELIEKNELDEAWKVLLQETIE